MKLKPLGRAKHQKKLSNHIHIRLTDTEYGQIQTLAQEVNLSMSEFVRRTVARRAMPRPLAAFDLKAYQVLCQINTELLRNYSTQLGIRKTSANNSRISEKSRQRTKERARAIAIANR